MFTEALIDILLTSTILISNQNYISSNFSFGLSSSNYLYKEYNDNGKVIDSETADDLYNFSLSYGKQFTPKHSLKLSLNYLFGVFTYDGSTWSGTPITYNTYNNYLINILTNYKYTQPINNSYTIKYNLGIGYRLWARGYDENNPNDYREYYKWFYASTGIDNIIKITNNIDSNIFIKYNQAINPTLKVMLGNNPTLNLGNTHGIDFGINVKFLNTQRQGFMLGYKYTYWHSNKSNSETLVLNNQNTQIYEPESDSKLQTISFEYFLSY